MSQEQRPKDGAVRCCIYARVSTEEQAERDLSIPFQVERCRYHAQGKGWEVVREMIDAGESARTDKRPGFQEMMAASRAREFDVILVHKLDRFARNDYDFVVYEKEMEELGITLESVSEPGDPSSPAGYISRRMMQVISSWYSKNLAVEVKKGMQQKVEKGGWPRRAPLGYVNRHDRYTSWVEVDPRMGSCISEAFREMATGRWTLVEWADHAYSLGQRTAKGNKIAKSTWSHIFHNRFYLGETYFKRTDAPIKGNHEPLADEETFVRVQEVLRAHDKYKQRTRRHKYLLRRLLYSLDADSPCWVETHPSKGISYYRTKGKSKNGNGKQVFYNSADIEGQLPAAFKAITITEDARGGLRRELQSFFAGESQADRELKRAEARLAKLKRMEKNLQRLVIEDEIPFEDFKEHRAQIESERTRLKNTVEVINSRRNLVRADFEIALELATQLDFLF